MTPKCIHLPKNGSRVTLFFNTKLLRNWHASSFSLPGTPRCSGAFALTLSWVDAPSCSEGGLSPPPGGWSRWSCSAEKVILGLPSLLNVSPGWKRGSSAPPTQLCWALTLTCRLLLVPLVVGGTGWGLGERLTQK